MNECPEVCRPTNDNVVDGFLLVGETKGERMAVTTNQFNSQHGLAPPTYSQTCTNAASSKWFTSALVDVLSGLRHVHCVPSRVSSREKEGKVGTEGKMLSTECSSSDQFNNNNFLPILDVPFTLAVKCQIKPLNICPEDCILRPFSVSKYDYDFSLERSCLRDSCGIP